MNTIADSRTRYLQTPVDASRDQAKANAAANMWGVRCILLLEIGCSGGDNQAWHQQTWTCTHCYSVHNSSLSQMALHCEGTAIPSPHASSWPWTRQYHSSLSKHQPMGDPQSLWQYARVLEFPIKGCAWDPGCHKRRDLKSANQCTNKYLYFNRSIYMLELFFRTTYTKQHGWNYWKVDDTIEQV